MKKIVVDTNLFLRFLLNDIPEQAKVLYSLFEKAESEEMILVVPQIVMFEITFQLLKTYKFDKYKVIDEIDKVLKLPYLEIQDKNIFTKALILFRLNNVVSFPDCFIKTYAKEYSAELKTFDKKLQKLAS